MVGGSEKTKPIYDNVAQTAFGRDHVCYRLFVKHGFLSPVFVDVVAVLAYPRAAPAQADRFDAEIAAA